MPRMSEQRNPSAGAQQADRLWIHDLRNAVNAAGLCVHAAEQLLIAGNVPKAITSLESAARSMKRIRDLLALPGDAE